MKKTLLALALGLASTSAMAATDTSASYDYLGGAYVHYDVEGGTTDGLNFDFSRSFTNNVFMQADYLRISENGFTLQTLSAQLGYAHPIAEKVDLVGTAGIAYEDLSAGSFSDSESGFIGSFGIRSRLSDKVELSATVVGTRFDEYNDTSYDFRGRFYFSDRFSADLGYLMGDDDQYALSAGVSYHF
jgi:hypothetical protein